MKIWLIMLSWILLVRGGKLYIRIKLWLQLLTFSLRLCDLIQVSQHFVAEHSAEDATISDSVRVLIALKVLHVSFPSASSLSRSEQFSSCYPMHSCIAPAYLPSLPVISIITRRYS